MIPILFPAMMALGYHPLWFGVVIVTLCELALITPPFGLNLFILRGMIPGGYDGGDHRRYSFPFMVTYLAIIFILAIFPQLSTWLPSLM